LQMGNECFTVFQRSYAAGVYQLCTSRSVVWVSYGLTDLVATGWIAPATLLLMV